MDNKNILITGGTGLVGTHLIPLLNKHGFKTAVLSRKKSSGGDQLFFNWDLNNDKIDQEAILWADVIIHLAGANVGEKKWSPKRKKLILESRTKTTALLGKAIEESGKRDIVFISASATGIYAVNTGEEMDESGTQGDDFLAHVTQEWEKSVLALKPLVERVVMVRTGVVLSSEGGALEKLVTPVKLYAGAPLGTGKQIVPWIHIDDLCEIYLYAIQNKSVSGPLNAVAPVADTNKEMTKAIANTLKKPLWLPNVPAFVLKVILGEMAEIVLSSCHVVPKALKNMGFTFKFTTLAAALEDLLPKKD